MHSRDKEKTAFMTDEANYYYEVMSFGLKNVGATHQRLMEKIFRGMIGPKIEVYVDDIVRKSDLCDQHVKDLEEVFEALKKTNMRLNPEKCTFGTEGGKFLGFMLIHHRIEANLEKCRAITEMKSPQNVKEVQQLIGRLTTLSRFVPRLAEWTWLMVQLFRKAVRFNWGEECEDTFQQLKKFLSSPTIIQKPRTDRTIIIYLSISEEVVSAILVKEVDKEEQSIYFASWTLHVVEARYQMIEKVAFALVLTTRRMRPFFQNHAIVERINYLIIKILSKPDQSV